MVTINEKSTRRQLSNGLKDSIVVDTSNILFIMSGAFQGIEKIVFEKGNFKVTALYYG